MAEEKAASSKLHWPDWIWVIGLFFLSVLVMLSFLPHSVTQALSLGISFRLGQLADFSGPYGSILYLFFLPSALVAAITMLVKRKAGWIASLVNLGISAVLLLICVAERSGELAFWQEIVAESVWFVVLAAWFAYFIKTKDRYGIEEKTNQPLPWPGWVWALGNFVLAVIISVLPLFQNLELGPSAYVLVQVIQFVFDVLVRVLSTYSVILLPLLVISTILMLFLRKLGWFVAVLMQLIFGFLLVPSISNVAEFLIVTARNVTDPVIFEKRMTAVSILTLLIVLGIIASWFVYFILARRRFGIGRQTEI